MSAMRWCPALFAVLALTGCERAMHDMYQQPKDKPLAPSPLFANGNSARTPSTGSVPMAGGAGADSSGGRLGRLSSVRPPGRALPPGANGQALVDGGSDYHKP